MVSTRRALTAPAKVGAEQEITSSTNLKLLEQLLRTPTDSNGLMRPELWALPHSYPKRSILDAALAAANVMLERGGARSVANVIGQLMVVTVVPGMEQSTQEDRLAFQITQIAAYTNLLGHLPNDLLTAAANHCASQSKFMPKPAELLEHAGPIYRERLLRRDRLQKLVDNVGVARIAPEKPFVPEPRITRLYQMRDSFYKIGWLNNAAPHEREIAKLEGREPAAWTFGDAIKQPPRQQIATDAQLEAAAADLDPELG